jgi:hypothetical protein
VWGAGRQSRYTVKLYIHGFKGAAMDSAANKQTVTRFNIEVIQQGRREAFRP